MDSEAGRNPECIGSPESLVCGMRGSGKGVDSGATLAKHVSTDEGMTYGEEIRAVREFLQGHPRKSWLREALSGAQEHAGQVAFTAG